MWGDARDIAALMHQKLVFLMVFNHCLKAFIDFQLFSRLLLQPAADKYELVLGLY